MPRRASGSIVEHRGQDGRVYRSLRYRFAGKRRTVPLGSVSAAEAEARLRHLMVDVERGVDPAPAVAEPVAVRDTPTFHEYAEEWCHRASPPRKAGK